MYQDPATRALAVLLLLLTVALLVNCGGGTSSSGTGSQRAVTQIIITPASLTLAKGTSVQLTATAVYNDGSKQDMTASVAWKTSSPNVAVISATGDLTAASTGTAQVMAQYQGVTGNNAVNVGPATLVSLGASPGQSSLPVGESEQLMATGTFTDGSMQDLTASASWSSSGSGIASVSASGTTTANAVGTATIRASSGSITGSALVTVTPAAPVALNIVPGAVSMALGSSRQLHADATFSDGSTQDMTGLVLWSSSEPTVATVSSGGMAVAEQVGSTQISAVGATLNASANATVVPLVTVDYFDLASAKKAGADSTVRLTNPGLTGGELCAMIYVFSQDQQMTECCGCQVTDSGLRSLSLVQDLTGNPLTGHEPQNGVLKIVPSDPTTNPQCDPGSLTPTGVILGWGNKVQTLPDGTLQVTETSFAFAPLSDGESAALANECNYVWQLGSGHGVCSCGTGN